MNPNGYQKLIYDAKFSGPRGDLNPMGLKVPGMISVQIFPKTAAKWILKNPDTDGQLCRTEFISPVAAMGHLSQIFAKQETDWVIRHPDGTPYVIAENPAPNPIKKRSRRSVIR